MSDELRKEHLWYIITSYFARYGLVRHQTESYDHFLTVSLPHIVQESSEIRVSADGVDHYITICNVSVLRPTVQEADGYDRKILPQLARMRGITYSVSVLVDIVHEMWQGGERKERRVFREVLLCKLCCFNP